MSEYQKNIPVFTVYGKMLISHLISDLSERQTIKLGSMREFPKIQQSVLDSFTISQPSSTKEQMMNNEVKPSQLGQTLSLLAQKLPQMHAATALGYTVGNIRMDYGVGTAVMVKSYTHAEQEEDIIRDYFLSKDLLPIVSNGVSLATTDSYVKIDPSGTLLFSMSARITKTNTTIETCGDLITIKDFHAQFKRDFPNDTFKVTIVDSIGEHGTNTRTQLINTADIKEQKKEFYPWFEADFEQYYEDFFKSNKNVLLLIGPPGTGKTSLCRNMLKSFGKEAMIANNEQLFKDSSIFEHYASSDAELLVIEDADNAVAPRTDGNAGMSYLLNLTDGIIPMKKKIVIVTNLSSINKVDSALLRPGRCFDVLEFTKLSAAQAEAARASIGLPQIELSGPMVKWTLAEALNYDTVLNIDARRTRGIGFGG